VTVATATSSSTGQIATPTAASAEAEPTLTSSISSTSSTSSAAGFGALTITSEPDDAELYVDGKFHGNTPATLKLPAGSHTIVLKSRGLPDSSRTIDVPASSKLSLKATFPNAEALP
jgi:hypothetical protein